MPYLGHWVGGFQVTSATREVPVAKLAMNGYLQLYRTDDKFLIQLSNPTQVLNLGGVWRMIGAHRIELTFNAFRIDEPDLTKLKGMRRAYLEPEDLKAAYSKPLILDLGPPGTLNGLLVRVGPLLGRHVFMKGQ
jgi:hypothetical protein